MTDSAMNWRNKGVRIVNKDQLDSNTAQTPGMHRMAAITMASANATKIWAGTVDIAPDAKTDAHHHGKLESVIYIVKGRARMRWGDQLEYTAVAEAGDFIFVPPYVPHQEMNASTTEPLECVLVRNDQDPIVINLDIDAVDSAEEVRWTDPHHPG